MKKNSKAAECVRAYRSVGEATDPLGSYTGLVRDFPDTDYRDADSPDANISQADFPGAYYPRTYYPQAYSVQADFPRAGFPLGQSAPGLEYMPVVGSLAEDHTILGERGYVDPELLPVQDADDL